MSTSKIRRWALPVVLVLGAAGASAFLLAELRESRTRAREADSRALAATALALADTSPEAAALLAVESLRLVDGGSAATTLEARSALITTLDHVARASVLARARPGTIRSVAFSPDGHTLAYGDRAGTVSVWDLRVRVDVVAFTGHRGSVQALAWSTDGSILASAGADRTIRLWDAEVRRPIATLTGHRGDVRHLAFSPDGATLASAGANWDNPRPDGTVRLWDVGRRRQIGKPLSIAAAGIHFAPTGRTLEVVNMVGWLTHHAVPHPRPFHEAGYDTSYTEYYDAAFTSAGAVLVLNGEGGLEARRVSGTRSRRIALPGNDVGQFYETSDVAAGERHVAAGTVDGVVAVWSAPDLLGLDGPQAPRSFAVRDGGSIELAFAPHDTAVAAVGADGALRIVPLPRDGRSPLTRKSPAALFAEPYLQKARTGGRRVVRTTFLADGSGPPVEIVVRDRTDGPIGQPLRSVSEAVALSPDGHYMALFDEAGRLRIRNIDEGKSVGSPLPLQVPEADVSRLAFSPDGKTLVATVSSGFLLWDVMRREPLGGPIQSPADDSIGLDPIVTSAAFETWRRRVCGVVARNLTREEWRRFAPRTGYRSTCPGAHPA